MMKFRSSSYFVGCYPRRCRRNPRGLDYCDCNRSGFTLAEFMVVVALVGILMAIAAPSWLRFLDKQRLNSAQSVVHLGMQQAQRKAQQNHAEWQFSIREMDGSVEWAVYPASALVVEWDEVGHSIVQLDAETTLQRSGSIRSIRFDQKGNIRSRLGRVTLSSRRFSDIKRCVYASTIIGALRQSKEQSTPRRGDFCY